MLVVYIVAQGTPDGGAQAWCSCGAAPCLCTTNLALCLEEASMTECSLRHVKPDCTVRTGDVEPIEHWLTAATFRDSTTVSQAWQSNNTTLKVCPGVHSINGHSYVQAPCKSQKYISEASPVPAQLPGGHCAQHFVTGFKTESIALSPLLQPEGLLWLHRSHKAECAARLVQHSQRAACPPPVCIP